MAAARRTDAAMKIESIEFACPPYKAFPELFFLYSSSETEICAPRGLEIHNDRARESGSLHINVSTMFRAKLPRHLACIMYQGNSFGEGPLSRSITLEKLDSGIRNYCPDTDDRSAGSTHFTPSKAVYTCVSSRTRIIQEEEEEEEREREGEGEYV